MVAVFTAKSHSQYDTHNNQVTYATPSAPGKSRILARFPFRFNDTNPTSLGSRLRRLIFSRVPDWLQHLQQNVVLDDDNNFLAQMERRLAARGGDWQSNFYLPTKADLFIAAFRKWISKIGRGGPFGEPKPEQLEPYDWRQPELLLDRYAQHTKHCASCSKALATVRRWRPRVMGAGIAAATLGKALLDLVLPGGACAWSGLLGLLCYRYNPHAMASVSSIKASRWPWLPS